VALREYQDASGVTWRVWMVKPEMRTGASTVPEGYETGWLCFESEAEKRRLCPVPASWEVRSDHELDVLLRAADPVPRR